MKQKEAERVQQAEDDYDLRPLCEISTAHQFTFGSLVYKLQKFGINLHRENGNKLVQVAKFVLKDTSYRELH